MRRRNRAVFVSSDSMNPSLGPRMTGSLPGSLTARFSRLTRPRFNARFHPSMNRTGSPAATCLAHSSKVRIGLAETTRV